MKRNPQLQFLKREKDAYGGELYKTRAGRSRGRPLATRHSMHIVLRSSKAKGSLAFNKPENEKWVRFYLQKFSKKFAVTVHSIGIVGNHIHLHIQLFKRQLYRGFIRALTSAIAIAVYKNHRWNDEYKIKPRPRFWDYRPFSRIVAGVRSFLNLQDYVRINQLEGYGHFRGEARFFVKFVDGNRNNRGSI